MSPTQKKWNDFAATLPGENIAESIICAASMACSSSRIAGMPKKELLKLVERCWERQEREDRAQRN